MRVRSGQRHEWQGKNIQLELKLIAKRKKQRILGNSAALRAFRCSVSPKQEEEVSMKRIAIAAAVLTATALGSIGYANAAGVEFGVGPRGVYVGERHHDDWRWRHRHHETYGFGRGCRTVVRTHINRFGERVSVRRRICD